MTLLKSKNKGAWAALTLAIAALFAGSPGYANTKAVHDREYWQAIIADEFTPPADVPLSVLLGELSKYLASTDPELRDNIAYSVLTQWLYVKRVVPVDLRREMIAEWTANLRQGIGESGSQSVLRRSFSALMLSVAAALDNEEPYLEREEFDSLLQAALAYLREERDIRGFDPDQGWLHSVAHTADLLKFLGRSRHLAANEQVEVLTAIAEKLSQLDEVLTHGEDERLARAVVSIVARPDVDMHALEAFLRALQQVRSDGLPRPPALAMNQNRKNLAVSLFAILNTDSRDLESVRTAREHVLAHLRTMM
jgi:hypothetical protein